MLRTLLLPRTSSGPCKVPTALGLCQPLSSSHTWLVSMLLYMASSSALMTTRPLMAFCNSLRLEDTVRDRRLNLGRRGGVGQTCMRERGVGGQGSKAQRRRAVIGAYCKWA